jgi:type VI secretion system protein ImpG
LPSMFIAEMTLDDAESASATGYPVRKGTSVETEPIQGEPCRFRTCYPVELLPVKVADAGFHSLPLRAPVTPRSSEAQGVVRIRLSRMSEEIRIGDLSTKALRFYLHGSGAHVYSLYEVMLNNAIEIGIAASSTDTNPIILSAGNLRPVGLEHDEGLLPYPPQALPGYRLLTEFFAYPAKFLFVELSGLDSVDLSRFEDSIEIFIYLNRTALDLEQNVSADTFRLGCTPVINLFDQHTEPVYLNHTSTEYRLSADARRPKSIEIHSVNSVTASSPEGDEFEMRPFYSASHHDAHGEAAAYWCHNRVPGAAEGGEIDHGTEIEMSFVDLDFSRALLPDWYVDIMATCCNRDLPGRLPFGGGQPRLHLAEGQGAVGAVNCLTPPTKTLRPTGRSSAMWRLISHLTLNHLSIVDGEDGANALREILYLYNFKDDLESRSIIDGIVKISSRRVSRRIPDDKHGAFCRGTEITIEFEPERYSQNNVYLFASVLERFLGLYCSINSFTRLIATVRGKELPLAKWEARAGNKVLI